MPIRSSSYPIGFPVFSITSTGNNSEFLIGGGGGGTKAGVKNAVVYYKIDPITLELNSIAEYVFPKQDDGCMSIAAHPINRAFICGVNSSAEIVKMGDNLNCRFFAIKNGVIKYCHERSVQTLKCLDPLHYQRVVRFSEDGKLVIAGTSDGHLTFWEWPEMMVCVKAQTFEKSEILDLHIDSANESVVVVTPTKLRVLDASSGKIKWAIEDVNISSKATEFRASRFGNHTGEAILFVVLNAKNKSAGYIQKYNTSDWSLIRTKKVSTKPITAFTISKSGHLIGFGSSDMSVTVLYGDTLGQCVRIVKAHSFPVTTMDFDCTASVVVSGSADGTVCVIAVPRASKAKVATAYAILAIIFLLTLFIFLPFDVQEL